MSWRKEGVKRYRDRDSELVIRPANFGTGVLQTGPDGKDHYISPGGEMALAKDGSYYENRGFLGRALRFFNPVG